MDDAADFIVLVHQHHFGFVVFRLFVAHQHIRHNNHDVALLHQPRRRAVEADHAAAALADMAAARQLTVDPEIFTYLLNHWRRDMDSLVQMLDTLDNYSMMMGKRITLPLLRQLLKQQEAE